MKMRIPFVIFLISLITCLFWLLSINFNIYQSSLTGSLYETLWFPMTIAIMVLPIISLVLWLSSKVKFPSWYLYALIIQISLIVYLALVS